MSDTPRLEDLTLRIRCGHEGTYTAYGLVVDGMKPHPLGESTGYNRGGGRTYAEWCPGGSETALTPADLLAVLTSMGAKEIDEQSFIPPGEYVVIRTDVFGLPEARRQR